ncbi:MAG: hypothetical protein M1812_003386 [Candelaria pacifica]|nr:MAG: hypothetical protein M1812_003386 [Candelaria pacifica]
MTTLTKPTLVLIHGAWHTAASFSSLISLLEEEGYPAQCISLPSVGASPGLPSFDADVTAIRTVIKPLIESNKQVILVMHSYGGLPGTEALQGLSEIERRKEGKEGGVVRLVYLAAFIAKVEQSAGMVHEEYKLPVIETELSAQDGTLFIKPGASELFFYNDLSAEEAKHHASLLKSHSPGAFGSPLTHESYRLIPSAYLIPTLDKALPAEAQRKMAQVANIELVEEIEAGHNPWLAQGGAVVRFIRKAAGEKV